MTYYVAKGKSISCKRGIVGEGEVICKDDLATPENFDILVKSDKGLIVTKKPVLPEDNVIELDLSKKELKQDVELSEKPKKNKKSKPDAGADKKSEDEKSEDNSDDKSGPDAGAEKK